MTGIATCRQQARKSGASKLTSLNQLIGTTLRSSLLGGLTYPKHEPLTRIFSQKFATKALKQLP